MEELELELLLQVFYCKGVSLGLIGEELIDYIDFLCDLYGVELC